MWRDQVLLASSFSEHEPGDVTPSPSPPPGDVAGGSQQVSCQVTIERGVTWCRLVGELDLASAPIVDAELRRLVNEGTRELVLDLSGLTFMDSSGLHLVVTWTQAAAEHGIAFSLIPGTPPVQRVFSIARVEEFLPFRTDR